MQVDKQRHVCPHKGCNKKYSRKPDLGRHYRGEHANDRRFKCRFGGCDRTIRGFARKDKRDVHERKMHMQLRRRASGIAIPPVLSLKKAAVSELSTLAAF